MKTLIKNGRIITSLFFLIAICSLSVVGQLSGNCLAQNNSGKSVSDEEYKIYSIVLKEKGTALIRNKTDMDADSKNIEMLERRGFESFFLKRTEAETMSDFLAKNESSQTLEKKIPLETDYEFISKEELIEKFEYKYDGGMNWENFCKVYPKALNLYTLSRVGFNQKKNQALVFVTNWCNTLCGEGNYYILKKENCEWKIVEKIMTWIS